MVVVPSYRTASIAGLWSSLGLVAFDAWLGQYQSPPPLINNLAWFLVLALFLYLPGYFLVVGASGTRFSRGWLANTAERERYLAVVKRVFVWLLVAGVASVLFARLLALALK